jgi:hypothetical protein
MPLELGLLVKTWSRDVGIGGRNHAVLEGVDAEALFELHAFAKRRANEVFRVG